MGGPRYREQGGRVLWRVCTSFLLQALRSSNVVLVLRTLFISTDMTFGSWLRKRHHGTEQRRRSRLSTRRVETLLCSLHTATWPSRSSSITPGLGSSTVTSPGTLAWAWPLSLLKARIQSPSKRFTGRLSIKHARTGRSGPKARHTRRMTLEFDMRLAQRQIPLCILDEKICRFSHAGKFYCTCIICPEANNSTNILVP